ncbi:uncharacterized protein LOC141905590 [Tubulanus polymorphus]|uniref:uncharacterized protein LOC141905590 n=1 Tax=Tubulanus polymorphus TaxID=672921 RepID=UPI003DA67D31
MDPYIHLIFLSGLFLGVSCSSYLSDDTQHLQKHQIMSRQIMNRRADTDCIMVEKCEMDYGAVEPICVHVCVKKGSKRALDVRQIMNRNIRLEGGIENGCSEKCVKLSEFERPICIDLCIDSGKKRFARQIMSRRRQIMEGYPNPSRSCTQKCVPLAGFSKPLCLELCLTSAPK